MPTAWRRTKPHLPVVAEMLGARIPPWSGGNGPRSHRRVRRCEKPRRRPGFAWVRPLAAAREVEGGEGAAAGIRVASHSPRGGTREGGWFDLTFYKGQSM